MTGAEKKAARLQREADAWNAAHPVGTPVRYWRRPAIRGEDPPAGESVVLRPAVALPAQHHVSVALAVGLALSITNVEALTVPLRMAKPRRERVSTRCGCGAPAMEGGVGLCGVCTFGEAAAGGEP